MSSTTGETAIAGAGGLGWDARARLRSLLRGRVDDPAWVRPTLVLLLAGTALLYLVGLGASGYANAFYSAAVEAASKSWKAFFFGSFDSSNFITVDKPPASLWVMDLSARLFGVNAWSILVPQALEGVAAVGLLYATIRRRFSAPAALLAGLALALTPVATLMFRFNNPDALLTLLLVASAYALTRSLEGASTVWLVLAGALIGVGFLTKMLQALLVVPGFAAVYLLVAPTRLRRALLQLAAAGVALVVAAGWWVAVVTLWPASSRPYVGGSQDNSILNLIFGYNGFGRITGNEAGSVIGGRTVGAGAGMWGPTGIGRLFGAEMGTQISWLLPAALLLAVAFLWSTRRAPRVDGRRGAVLLWGSWLVVTGLVFSFAQGIIHPYYTVALAPAIAALFGIGVVWAWTGRAALTPRLSLAIAVGGSAVWADRLLDRTPTWLPWLRLSVLAGGLLCAVLIALPPSLWSRARIPGSLLVGLALSTALAAPAAYALHTASVPHSGSLPTAGPSGASVQGGPGGGAPGAGRGGTGFPGAGRVTGAPAGGPGGGFAPGGAAPGAASRSAGLGAGFGPGAGAGGFTGGGSGRGGALGGLLNAGTPSSALVKLLAHDADRYRWVAAAVGANSAAGVELAVDEPVMAIGGFNGTDPTPTLAAFEADVRAGEIHYYLAEGAGGGQGSSASAQAIASWVEAHYRSESVGGVTVYDLASAATTAA